ncbi:hypothetical protein ACIOHC_36370 [Streptomyces sp. NPDC088252]|uniref:hypothetical protein n=1 Tax=Streptomyces sp. NPDC088252 TaxID=3365845 RepID=UPI0037FFE4DE
MASAIRAAGVFDTAEDAMDLIRALPEILVELGLGRRFAVLSAPARVMERQKRGRFTGVAQIYFEARIRDRTPHLPPPDICALDIAQARERIERREQDRIERERHVAENAARYAAFGRSQPLSAWARTFSTTVTTLNKYVETHGDLETALTEIALKKHRAA